MEDGGAGGDNHSDRDSNKFGNGIVYALTGKRVNPIGFALCSYILVAV